MSFIWFLTEITVRVATRIHWFQKLLILNVQFVVQNIVFQGCRPLSMKPDLNVSFFSVINSQNKDIIVFANSLHCWLLWERFGWDLYWKSVFMEIKRKLLKFTFLYEKKNFLIIKVWNFNKKKITNTDNLNQHLTPTLLCFALNPSKMTNFLKKFIDKQTVSFYISLESVANHPKLWNYFWVLRYCPFFWPVWCHLLTQSVLVEKR